MHRFSNRVWNRIENVKKQGEIGRYMGNREKYGQGKYGEILLNMGKRVNIEKCG